MLKLLRNYDTEKYYNSVKRNVNSNLGIRRDIRQLDGSYKRISLRKRDYFLLIILLQLIGIKEILWEI